MKKITFKDIALSLFFLILILNTIDFFQTVYAINNTDLQEANSLVIKSMLNGTLFFSKFIVLSFLILIMMYIYNKIKTSEMLDAGLSIFLVIPATYLLVLVVSNLKLLIGV